MSAAAAAPVADTGHAAFQRGTEKRASPPPRDKANPAFSPPMTPEQKSEDDYGLVSPIQSITPTDVPSDALLSDNYVTKTLQNQKHLPPVTSKNLLQNISWISTLVLTVTPSLAIYGALTTNFCWKTAVWSVIYYFITGLGITAGYHRLWSHRSYNASTPLQYGLAAAGAGAVQGSIKWWSRGHRAHHRYTDTKLDPYSSHEGFWWAHVGWMIFKPRTRIGSADVSDLSRNPVVRWQHRNYLSLIFIMGLFFPTAVAGLGWGDWRGGFFFAGAARLVFVHHSTFCVNSLAHWLGDAPFDNKHTPRDHFITALVTIGEGYHNFHHQFPMDFRNAIRWFQYDPTKWFIWTMQLFGLASHLKKFPDNEIKKGQFTMKLQKLKEEQDAITWPIDSNKLPVISWDDFLSESKNRPLMVVHGFIHDVSSFIEEHPGGAHLVKRAIGTDATTAFFGGVYDHSAFAHNLLSMMRVGIIDGGYDVLHMRNQKRYRSASNASASSSEAESSSESIASGSAYSATDIELAEKCTEAERKHLLELAAKIGRKGAPLFQPQAWTVDPDSLHLPPSQVLLIKESEPESRSRFRLSADHEHDPLETRTMADAIGDIAPIAA